MAEQASPFAGPLRSALLAAALDACPVGLCIQDADGRTVAANPAAHARLPSLAANDAAASPDGIRDPYLAEDSLDADTQSFRHEGRDFVLTSFLNGNKERDAQRELLRLAYIDNLTGLPNRMLIEEHVEELIAAGSPFGVAFIDLDNFKYVNDYYGHAVGDLLLRKIAERVVSCLRGTDMLARVGGDEFVLLITPAPDESSAHGFALDVAEKLKQPYFIDGHEIFASASTGISMFPLHGDNFDSLRRQADSAMYKVKQKGKGGVIVFDSAISAEASSRMAVEQRLRLVIRDCRVCCAFQPKVEMRTGKVTGIEVLLRWRDEEGVIQAPGQFINLAVELGLINEIAFRMLTETVRSVPLIDETFGPDVSISLNVAAKQAGDLSFMVDFIDAIAATGLAERFILELTEEAFFTKGPFQLQVMPRLRDSGIRVSIDDFGVGYSSLGSLAEIHADELKIDRSFITAIHQRPRSQMVLKAIERLGSSLDMRVVAEGVETQEEADYLVEHTGITCAQGYLFGRPTVIGETDPDTLQQLSTLTAAEQRWTPLTRQLQNSRAVRSAAS